MLAITRNMWQHLQKLQVWESKQMLGLIYKLTNYNQLLMQSFIATTRQYARILNKHLNIFLASV